MALRMAAWLAFGQVSGQLVERVDTDEHDRGPGFGVFSRRRFEAGVVDEIQSAAGFAALGQIGALINGVQPAVDGEVGLVGDIQCGARGVG